MVLSTILTKKYATQEEIDAINQRVNNTVAESVKFAEESPWPDDSEVLKDVYMDKNYPFIVD
jgi:pyruvate dehydrogenase E1 component alpha subunit